MGRAPVGRPVGIICSSRGSHGSPGAWSRHVLGHPRVHTLISSVQVASGSRGSRTHLPTRGPPPRSKRGTGGHRSAAHALGPFAPRAARTAVLTHAACPSRRRAGCQPSSRCRHVPPVVPTRAAGTPGCPIRRRLLTLAIDIPTIGVQPVCLVSGWTAQQRCLSAQQLCRHEPEEAASWHTCVGPAEPAAER